MTPLARPELDLVGTWVRAFSLRNRLLAWFDRERRPLPWRRDQDPYRVLVSEIMLQQTRVDVVIPYFERWTALWPDFASLAAAAEEDVLAAWSGLGYYRRARWLHGIAKAVVAEHAGRLPRDVAALRELPGVGEYTAAAVASIAFGVAVPVVDGNVDRVLTRILALPDPPGATRLAVVREAARRIVSLEVPAGGGPGGGSGPPAGAAPEDGHPPGGLRPGETNQALMELGSLVCVPGEPRCPSCPVAKSCLGNRAGVASLLPVRAAPQRVREVALRSAVVRCAGHVLVVRRDRSDALLAGLWELPTTADGGTLADLRAVVARLVPGAPPEFPRRAARSYRHAITNRRIRVRVHEADLPGDVPPGPAPGAPEVRWVRPEEIAGLGVSSMTRKALA